MRKVFSQENFKVVFSSIEKIREELKAKAYAFFTFDPEGKSSMMLPMEGGEFANHRDYRISAVRHEFWHARHYQLHQYKPCQVKYPVRMTPVFPVTPDNIQRYHEALDKGDERIKEFMKLRWKYIKKEALTAEQKAVLKTYLKACDGILVYPLHHKATPGLMTKLNRQFSQESVREGSTDIKVKGVGLIKIIGIGRGYDDEILIQPMNEQQMLILLPDHIKLLLRLYKNEGAEILLSERDALLRQGITDDTFKTFYPEAYQMQQDYEAYCDPDYHKPTL